MKSQVLFLLPTIRSLKPRFAGSDYGLKMSRESPDSFKLARVGDTKFQLQSVERYANSTDSFGRKNVNFRVTSPTRIFLVDLLTSLWLI